MARIPARVVSRLTEGLKRYQPIVSAAKAKDLNEADTSRVVTDMLSDIFGYDKYEEITSEYCIRSTYCDLAIKINGQPKLLIEVKAVGLELKDTHIKQAVDYAANQGMDWVILTNAFSWKVFKIVFGKPIDNEEIVAFDFGNLSAKKEDDVALLFLVAKEGLDCSALADYAAQVRAVNKYTVGAIISSEPVIKVIKHELSRMSPEVKIHYEDIELVLVNEVLKREVIEAEEGKIAAKKVQRELSRLDRKKENEKLEVEVSETGALKNGSPSAATSVIENIPDTSTGTA